MSLTARAVPAENWPEGTKVDLAKLRATASPAIALEGKLAANQLGAVVDQTHVKPAPFWYAEDENLTANDYSITLDPAPAALADGLLIQFLAGATNTGASTLTEDVLGWDPLESTCRHASLSIL